MRRSQKNDVRNGVLLLGQIVAVAPNESANWLRLARAILQIRSPTSASARCCSSAPRPPPTSPISAPATATRRRKASAILGRTFADRRMWRPALDALRLSLELREVADVRAAVRADARGSRLPHARLFGRFRCGLAARLLPVLRGAAGQAHRLLAVRRASPARTSRRCRRRRSSSASRGCKHGERYSVTLRAGLPSTVKETLSKSADFTIYVRDRKPFVRFTGKAYVLPRTGQRGIPVVSVNTEAVNIADLSGRRPQPDRAPCSAAISSATSTATSSSGSAKSRGLKVWKGELAVEPTLNADVTTAFPVDQAVGTLQPGVYVMAAEPAKAKDAGRHEDRADPVVHRLRPRAGRVFRQRRHQRVRPFARHHRGRRPDRGAAASPATTRCWPPAAPMRPASCASRPASRAARAALAPAMLVASDAARRLRLPQSQAARRSTSPTAASPGAQPGRARCLRLRRARRLSHRRDRAPHRAAARRAGRRRARRAADARGRAAGRRRISPRAVADQGVGGRRLSVPIVASAPTGTWRVRAFTDPKRPAVGETTFMVEDYVPDRLEFELASPSGRIARATPAEVTLDGRYLYGAPASGLELEGEVSVAAAKERPGLAGYQFGSPTRTIGERAPADSRTCRRPTPRARRASPSRSRSCRRPRGRSRPR